MDTFDQIASKIIKEQELLIGDLAWEEALDVEHLHVVDKQSGVVDIDPGVDSKEVINTLVSRYVDLFGRAARESCREAVLMLVADLAPSDVPSSLK